jgi:putative serine protease PepD
MTDDDDHEPVIGPDPDGPTSDASNGSDLPVDAGNGEPPNAVGNPASTHPGSSTAPPGDPGVPSAGSPEPPTGEPPGWSQAPNPWAPPGIDPSPYEPSPVPPYAERATEPIAAVPVGDEHPSSTSEWAPPGSSAWKSPKPNRPRRASQSALVGGLVGALVASLVTAGAFLIFGRDDNSSSPATAPLRPASVIVHNGDIQAILRKVQPAVVRIDVSSPDDSGTGTGFIVASDGVIVTNAHVAGGAFNIKVTLADSRTARATVIGIDRNHDLAVLRIGLKNLPVVELGDSSALEVGDSVVAIGNALALEGTPTVTSGIISALHRTISTEESTQLTDVIQTDAAINPGNSGGPLLDSSGRVIGINTAIASPADANNIGFAIAISSAEPTLKKLEEGQGAPARTGFLGVNVESVDASVKAAEHLSVDRGAWVADVTADSPASAAGIKAGDVIVRLDSTAIDTAQALTAAVQSRRPGTKVTVVVNRAGTTRTFHATLDSLPTS